MAALGRLTALAIVALLAGGVLLGIRSIPDIQRYLRIRSM